ncbi:hypothetical protein BEL04_17510 [Mucilaginibacter sp. PPCGB 2223]|nr:hypothetical protein BEL04_17510 [Mucilaginibacter sp. PPCGB 2223]
METLRKIGVAIRRSFFALRRPSKQGNSMRLKERGEKPEDMLIREASIDDIPALAELHAKTWAETYWTVKKPPTAELRAWQWHEQFKVPGNSWFCFVLENKTGKLVGFAKGIVEKNGKGGLNKIYLLQQYQRLGLGRLLIGAVAHRFLRLNINFMSVYAEASNPSCWFYEAMGGVKSRHANGQINHGGYYWPDLHQLAENFKP